MTVLKTCTLKDIVCEENCRTQFYYCVLLLDWNEEINDVWYCQNVKKSET